MSSNNKYQTIRTYDDFPGYLDCLQEHAIRPGLDRIREACFRLKNPERRFKSVHIAGTNGKGSTAAFLESVLRNSGYRVGLYTSPHLTDVRERIQFGRCWITEDDVIKYASVIQDKCNDLSLSYFEFLTALAFLYFAEKEVGLAVLEAGLGGRWDATNVVDPVLTIMTPISIDHTQYLGGDILSIAVEKCGIIKPGVTLVTGMQDHDVSCLIEKTCHERGSPLVVSEAAIDAKNVGLAGGYQVENACLVLRAAEVLGQSGYSIKNAEKHLLNIDWPGRLQKISEDPEIILDGAHNTGACRCLVKHIDDVYKNRDVVIIFAVMKDKDYVEMIRILQGIAKGWVLFSMECGRAAEAGQLRPVIKSDNVAFASSTASAVKQAMGFGFKNPLIIVTGSLYLVGRWLV